MATETIVGPLGEVQAASTAGGGTALTTTAGYIQLPVGTKHIDIVPRNFATAVVAQWLKCPWLTILKTTDAGETFIDYSYVAQDGSTSTSVDLSSLSTLANGDALYVGSHVPFGGAYIDVDGPNGTASDLTVSYWNGATWTAISETDNTDTGAALAVDGTVTWTVPSAWISAELRKVASAIGLTPAVVHQGARPGMVPELDVLGERLFWTRWEWSAAMDSATTLDSMLGLSRQTVYHEIPSGMAWQEAVTVGPGGIAAIQAKTDAGTANLLVLCAARGRFA